MEDVTPLTFGSLHTTSDREEEAKWMTRDRMGVVTERQIIYSERRRQEAASPRKQTNGDETSFLSKRLVCDSEEVERLEFPEVTAGRVSSLPVVPRSLRSRSLLPCMRWESVASHRVNCDEELKAWHLDLPFIPISCLSLASDGGSEAWATDRHEASMRWEWSSVVASLVPGLLRALHLQSASHRRAGESDERQRGTRNPKSES